MALSVVAASQRVRELGDVSVRLAARDAAEAARRLVWRGFRFLTGPRCWVRGGAGAAAASGDSNKNKGLRDLFHIS